MPFLPEQEEKALFYDFRLLFHPVQVSGSVGGYGASDSCAAVYGVFLSGAVSRPGVVRLAFVVVDVGCVHELSSALLAGEVVRTPFFI